MIYFQTNKRAKAQREAVVTERRQFENDEDHIWDEETDIIMRELPMRKFPYCVAC